MTHVETNSTLNAKSAVEAPAAVAQVEKIEKPQDTAKDKGAKAEKPKGDAEEKEHMSVGAMRHDPIVIRKLFESGEYPYAQRMRVKPYEEHMIALQQELLKAQRWIEESGEKIMVLFEG
ncbi:MAG TPA: polyphosphate kinase 2, partial [Beijerinckiaceae bacterium]|nr:polyphosphate kinase 2 [Beijerinckiaceae bacterium]